MTLRLVDEAQAVAEHDRLLGEVRFHRKQATRAKRALDRLEADCARVGIRLIRVRPEEGETHGNHPTSG